MAEETLTEDKIAKHYQSMLDSVGVINNGTKEIWMTDEDMTAVDAAIG